MALRQSERAVDALHGFVVANLQTYLTQVETERGLAAGALRFPVAVLDYMAPADNRSPLVQIYEQNYRPHRPAGQRNNIWIVRCVIIWSYVNEHGASPEAQSAAELRMRRYADATVRTIESDASLGRESCQALITNADARRIEGDQSSTRHLYGFSLDVFVDNSE